jgi:hypothetical protein
MCVLAATGQLGGSQMVELSAHIAECDACREFLGSVSQVSVQVMPLLAEAHGLKTEDAAPAGMRERFVARLESESVHRENALRVSAFPAPKPQLLSPFDRKNPDTALSENSQPRSSVRISSVIWGSAAAVAVCTIVGYLAFHAGERETRKAFRPAVVTAPIHASAGQASPVSAPRKDESDRVAAFERQTADLQAELTTAQQELSSAEAEKKSLTESLSAAKTQLAAHTAGAEAVERTTSEQVQAGGVQLASLQEQVDRLTRRLAESDVKLTAQKQEGDELAVKLDAAQSELQRERDLKSAKLEMGDIVAARNLHIVDVYDAGPSGNRQRSFGRVFYIEGKSLVFYAYDLDAPDHFRKDVTFHVWGGKAGVSDVSHSLGILHKDDDGQGRWAMTFDDPAVLAQINSVFVTAEPADRQINAPRGKKVLYAYFGNKPNHP